MLEDGVSSIHDSGVSQVRLADSLSVRGDGIAAASPVGG
jgi:hypothetical protein